MRSSSGGRSVEYAVGRRQCGGRVRAVSTFEIVQFAERARRGDLEDRAIAVFPSAVGDAIKHAV